MTDTPETTEKRRVEYRPIGSLSEDPRNPKAHSTSDIAASIGRFGFIEPVVLDERTGHIISGHGRTKVLTAMRDEGQSPPEGVRVDDSGEWHVPVAVGWASRTDLDAAGALIALNRTTELGGWVDDELLDLLEELSEDDEQGFEGVGYGSDDLEDLRERLEHIGEGLEPDEDAPEHVQGEYEAGEAAPTLADRYGIPPTSVFNTLRGEWQVRKRDWVAQGIDSGEGREEDLVYDSAARKYTNWFDVVNRVSKTLGYRPSDSYVEENHQAELNHTGAGTSIFDPVLTELMYLWHTREGQTILDPWAGGSVRGIVAALLGRNYIGIDIRPEQVEANKKQWDKRLQAQEQSPAEDLETTDDPQAITPVQRAGNIWLKREDSFRIGNGLAGAKERAIYAHALNNPDKNRLITCGSRPSQQAARIGAVAEVLGWKATAHMPSGELTPPMQHARSLGVDIQQHAPGYLTVLKKRAEEDAEADPDALLIPFGVAIDEAVELARPQVSNIPEEAKRLVITVGSGTTLSGVLHGLKDRGLDMPVLGIRVGSDPEETLDRLAPEGWRDMVSLVDSPLAYEEEAPVTVYEGVELDPNYEAKAIEFLEEGDVFWIVGPPPMKRVSQVGSIEWHLGDSAQALAEMEPDSVDMLFGCPPYYFLEKYSDDPDDLSNLTPEEFDERMAVTIERAARVLRDNSFAVFVVGSVRDKSSRILDMRRCMVDAAERAGLWLYNDAVLLTPVGSVRFTMGKVFRERRILSRVHQEVLVFVKGNAKEAATRAGGDSFDLSKDIDALLAGAEDVEVPEAGEEEIGVDE